MLALLLSPSKAPAEVGSAEISDFGAETIESDNDVVAPLPVELVEERVPEEDVGSLAVNKALGNSALEKFRAQGPNSKAEGTSQTGAQVKPKEASTTILNVKDADLTTLIKTFSKITKRNYLVDSNVKGKVTIHLPSPVTLSEAIRIFDSVLLLKGFTTVPIGNNIWKVIQAADAKQTTVPLVLDAPDIPSDTLVTQLIRLKHVQAADMQQLLNQFVSKGGLMNAFEGTNSLLLIDSAANIRRLQELIEQLDVPAVDQDITIIPILYATADDIAEKIKEILGEEEQSNTRTAARTANRTATRTTTTRGRRTTTNVQTGRTVARRALPLKIISDERTNSIIIVADPELTAKVRGLVEKLDSKVDFSGGKFYVYRLKHADAEELSEILNQLISGAESSSDSQASGTTGSSLSSSRNTRSSTRNTTATTRRTSATSRSGSSSGPAGRVSFEGEVSIAPDPATNSLIVNASRADYQSLREVIAELDIQRRQVLVEATILEVSLSKDEGMGIELQGSLGTDEGGVLAQTNFGGLTNVLTNPAALSDLTIAAASTGTITLPGGLTIPSQAILVSALSRISNVNVLSSPTILATDNEEAEIIVGENVPFVTSTSTDNSNINNTFNQIERQDVGITLRITPQIATGNFVILKIFVEISNVVPGTRNDPNGPTTTIRTTETTVEVKNGQMIVTGGLISDSVTESTRGVPFFQDIPVVGHYFQREDVIERRTNLLVFITPRVIKDQFDARETTRNIAGDMSSIIAEYGAEPSRNDILDSRKMDQVIDWSTEEDVPLPTMITPPNRVNPRAMLPNTAGSGSSKERAALERTMRRFEQSVTQEKETQAKDDEDDAQAGEDEEVIDITVSPKLPLAGLNTSKTKAASVQLASVPRVQASGGGTKTFVVLMDTLEDRPANKSFPLRYGSDGSSLGLALPGGIDSQTTRHFQAGGRYTFQHGTEKRDFVCLGRYSSFEEAKIVHPSLASAGNFNNLSPQQLLTLGRENWRIR